MVTNNIIIENARIAFRNFSGEEGKFNPKGRRNFCVLFDDEEFVKQLEDEGWNIRRLQPKEDGDDPVPYIQVSVSFGKIPPNIVLITSNGKTKLDEDSVNILDWAEIKSVDLIIKPYNWEVNNQVGVKAYLKSMYVTIVEDEFAKKYSDIPDSAESAFGDD